MVFSDVLAVLFEELFCLEKKRCCTWFVLQQISKSDLSLDIFEGILKVKFKANTWALCNVNKTLCLWTFQLIWFFFPLHAKWCSGFECFCISFFLCKWHWHCYLRSCLITFVVLRTWNYSASDLLLILSVDSLASAVYGNATFSFINMFVVKKKNEYNHRFWTNFLTFFIQKS